MAARKKVIRRTAASPAIHFHTLTETAEILRMGINQTAKAIGRGEIRAKKFGKSYRISTREIERLKRADDPPPRNSS